MARSRLDRVRSTWMGFWGRSLSVCNCLNATRCDPNGIDFQAFSLISKIAHHIQAIGAFPDKVCYVK